MNKEELDLFLSQDMQDIGKCFPKGKLPNNHHYKQDTKYIHMFRNLKDINCIKYNRNFEYLAEFDIPMLTLMISKGKGIYNYIKGGKIKQKYVKEYAIRVDKIKSEYFVAYQKIENSNEDIKETIDYLDKGIKLTQVQGEYDISQ